MHRYLTSLLVFFPLILFAQTSNDNLVRGFPITDYMVDLNDSTKIVQVHLEQSGVIMLKQVGVLKSAYVVGEKKPEVIGTGRCNLIKGNYYYYTINFKESGVIPKKGDLLYILAAKPSVFVDRLVNLAAHSITLVDLYDKPFYDLSTIFNLWTKNNEKTTIDSMLRDIHFTADYFLKNEPSINTKIKSGANKGELILNVMKESTLKDLNAFLDYMKNHSRIYAGNDWKISEIFATWLSEGSPMP